MTEPPLQSLMERCVYRRDFNMTEAPLQRLTKCSICLEDFTDPRMLSCFHTFCLECLQKTCEASSAKKPGESTPCPLCRKPFSIPTEGTNGLQKNFFVQHLLEIKTNIQLRATSAVACDICKQLCEDDDEKPNRAIRRCLECEQDLCERCAKGHTLQKSSKSHRVADIGKETEDDFRKMFSTRNCTDHKEKQLEFYCPQCKIIACGVCTVENHSPHGCKAVSKVEEEFRQVIERNAYKISTYAAEVLPKSKSMEQRKENILENLEAVENEIKQRNVKLKEMIDSGTKFLLDELLEIKKKHIKEFENEKEEIERRYTILKSFETYCAELRSKGSASDICGCVDELVMRADELEKDHEQFIGRPLQKVEVYFSPTEVGEIGNTSPMNIVGRIQETVAQLENCAVVAGLNDGRSSMKNVFKISLHRPHEISPQQETPSKMQDGSAAAVYSSTMYITGLGDNNDEIWSYSYVSGWLKCASLVHGRSGHCSEFMNEILYVCGGWSSSKKQTLSSVEAYNVSTNACSVVGKLVRFVKNSGNCVPFKSSLYIFGGSDKFSNALNGVQVYDTKLNTCSLLSKRMPQRCKLMRAVLCGTSVILFGCDTCLMFNLETKTWEERSKFKTGVIHFGLVLENERIFVIGGGIHVTDDAGKLSWKCRDDVRYVPLQSFIEDKAVEWKSYARLAKPALVHCYGKMLLGSK